MKNFTKVLGIVAMASTLSMVGCGTTHASENPTTGKASIGYQGVLGGNLLNGVSTRYWVNDNVGLEGNLFYGTAGIDIGSSHIGDANLFLGTAKVLYSPVVKENSKFYVGVEGGYGSVGLNDATHSLIPDTTIWTVEPLVGVEFGVKELPELAFNFEVGYKFNHVNIDTPDEVDLNLDGVTVAVGAHYYF
jgi:hypothetical protein